MRCTKDAMLAVAGMRKGRNRSAILPMPSCKPGATISSCSNTTI
jgi:hypothetical protein